MRAFSYEEQGTPLSRTLNESVIIISNTVLGHDGTEATEPCPRVGTTVLYIVYVSTIRVGHVSLM